MTNTTTVTCFCFRYESLGYDSAGDALVALDWTVLDQLVVDSGRPARREDEDGSAWYEVLGDMCDEPDHHTGPHRFVPRHAVVLVFPPAVMT